MTPTQFICDLGDGLVLRRSGAGDAAALAAFNKEIHKDALVGEWTFDLLSGRHPTHAVDDFTIVENTQTGEIISCMNLISQTWSYAGIPFKVGRPELVGTRVAYRNRGLVRRQFEVIHRWSAEREEVMQVITGIPYYYRLFGYEMAVNLDGSYVGFAPQLPDLPVLAEGQAPAYRFRAAVPQDVPFILACYRLGCQRDLLACEWDEKLFLHEFDKRPGNVNRRALFILENSTGEGLGFAALPPNLWGATRFATRFELRSGVAWAAVAPYFIRFLWENGQELAREESKTCTAFGVQFYENHPLLKVASGRFPQRTAPYTWYLRLPDVAGFLRLITPVLEQRLTLSAFAGYTRRLDLSFYRSGVRLDFQQGRLASIEEYKPEPDVWDSAGFSGLSFLQLLFGHRTPAQLSEAFPDCWSADGEVSAALEALFPRQPSCIWAVS
jgi:hypothetical protein